MISLHHAHLFASHVDRSIAFWREHFGAVVLVDADFAGARNVFLRVGEGRLHLRPYTYWNRLGVDMRVDSLAREMALAWGHDHIVVDTTRTKDVNNSIYTQNTAHLRGKPALTTETGAMGHADEAMVDLNVQGAMRMLRFLGMLPGPVERVDAPVWLIPYEVLTSPETGTWLPAVERGHTVAKGALVGTVGDLFGNPVAAVRAPFDGEVMYVVGPCRRRAGANRSP